MVWGRMHTASLCVFIACVLAVIVWDVYIVLFTNTPGATISYSVYHAARKSPIIAFIAGVIMGHLFWPTLDLNKSSIDNVESGVISNMCKECSGDACK